MEQQDKTIQEMTTTVTEDYSSDSCSDWELYDAQDATGV